MSTIITSDNGIELEVCSLGIAVVNHEEETETWARLTDVQRVELAAALDPGRRGLHVRLDNQADTLATFQRERDEAVARADDLDKRLAKVMSDYQDLEDERDAAVARAEQAEREVSKVEGRASEWSIKAKEWQVRAEAAEARTAPAVPLHQPDGTRMDASHLPIGADDDPAVLVVRESDLPAARVDGDYYVVASAKGDYKWPQHGPSWWAGRAQDALAEAARYTSLARLAADREATVDPVDAKARVEADRRYSGDPNHAFIEGALWANRHVLGGENAL